MRPTIQLSKRLVAARLSTPMGLTKYCERIKLTKACLTITSEVTAFTVKSPTSPRLSITTLVQDTWLLRLAFSIKTDAARGINHASH